MERSAEPIVVSSSVLSTDGTRCDLPWRIGDVAHYVDDFFGTSKTKLGATEKGLRLKQLVLRWGLGWNAEKLEIGQRLAYTGIMIDSVRMMISFEPDMC